MVYGADGSAVANGSEVANGSGDVGIGSTRSPKTPRSVRCAAALMCLGIFAALTSAGASLAASQGMTASALAHPPGTFVLKHAPIATVPLLGASAPPFILAQDALNLEEKQGYTTEYIFGLSKGTMRSTLVPALKPFVLIFTVPLDLAFLPFAAIAGAL